MRLRQYLILIIGLARIVLSQDDSWKLFDDSEVDPCEKRRHAR